MNSKIAILGDGLLGKEIHSQTGWDIISRKKDNFDITASDLYYSFLLESYNGVIVWPKYDILVNCIAFTDTYSNDKDTHWDVNYKGTANLVDFCNMYSIKLVHISTDYVYINSVNNASENDVPVHGNNWYSYTKLLADSYIELKSNKYLICRGTHKSNPFIYDKAWIDQIGNFDYVNVISKLIVNLINTQATGTFNVGTDLKTIYNLASQTKSVTPAFKPEHVPSNTSINTDKLKSWLLKN
jgi:hypothetical protein